MTDTPLIERLEDSLRRFEGTKIFPRVRPSDLAEAIAILRGEADDLSSISDEALIREGARRRRAQITDEDRAWATASAEMIFGKDGKSDPDDLARVASDAIDRATKAEAELAILRGEGWRPIESAPREPDQYGLTPTIILGFAPDEEGYSLPSHEGYWRPAVSTFTPAEKPGWVTCIDPNVPEPYAQPTHWRPLPAPPEVGAI